LSKRINLINNLRQKLLNGNFSIGTWQQIPSPSISEILANAGYDWIAIDMEHGSISIDQLPNIFRAIELSETLSLVRLAESSPRECKRALDAGAAGIIAPMINNGKQLLEIKEACCWPPMGNRGVGYSRANLFGKEFEHYTEEAKAPFLVAQIEHINAVENLEDILLVKGLDAILVGPYDLSASMNLTGNFQHKDFKNVIKKIMSVANDFNIPCGDHLLKLDSQLLIERIREGFRFIAYCTDGVFLNSASEYPNIKKL